MVLFSNQIGVVSLKSMLILFSKKKAAITEIK